MTREQCGVLLYDGKLITVLNKARNRVPILLREPGMRVVVSFIRRGDNLVPFFREMPLSE